MRIGSIANVNLVDVLLPTTREAGIACVDSSGALSVPALREAVGAQAAALVAAGLQPGERVAFIAPNTCTTVVTYLAVLAAGGVAVPLNPQSPLPERQRQLERVAVRFGPEDVPAPSPGTPFSAVERADDDVAVLLFTSGTIGAPRAAMLTHGSMRANLEHVGGDPSLRLTPDDVTLCALPLFHVFGCNVALALALRAGAPVVLVEPQDLAAAVAAIREHAVRVIAAVPTAYGAWLGSDLPNDAFASVRLAVSGAAALPVMIAEVFRARFGVAIREGYGLTEASPIVSVAGADDPLGCVGRPLPGVAMRLVDCADGVADVLPGDVGEVWVRGANVFAGYWGEPDATAAVLDDDGWLHTGDIGVLDSNGRLRLLDRKKDLIIVSGFNVFPGEVEAVLATEPAVRDVAVIGEPDAKTGETVVAWVVPDPDAGLDVGALLMRCRAELARYKCPTRIEVVEALPQSATGKVLRRMLRQRGSDRRS